MVINGNIASSSFTQGIGQRMKQSCHLTNPPNFGVGGMPSKSVSNMSDEKIREKMVELAKKDVAAGRPFYDRSSSEYNELMRDYVSAVSPDRQRIVNNSLSNLAGKLGVMASRPNFAHDLLSLLMGHSVVFNSRDIGTNFIQFRDTNGDIIARYSELPSGGGMGWTHSETRAESARIANWQVYITKRGNMPKANLKYSGIMQLLKLKEKH